LAVTALLHGLLATTSLNAQEWTRFRGPNGTGVSDAQGIPESWTEADYNWRVALPGSGHSSPVIWGDKVFVTSADPVSGTRWLICLKAADGSQQWKKEFSAAAHPVHSQNSLASSTPAVDENHVYFVWATPSEYTMAALDHAGKSVWRVDLGPFSSQHGFGASPIVYQDMVVLGNEQDGESSLLALDCRTGATRWKTPRKPSVTAYSTPCVFNPDKDSPELIFNSQSHGISSVNPASGKVNWEIPVFARRSVSSPLIVAGLAMGTCGEGKGDNTMVAVRLPKAGSQKDAQPTVAYEIDKTSAPYVPTLIANGNLVFLWSDRGVVTCIDAPTGKVYWRERVGGNYSGSPIRVRDRLYCVSSDGEAVVLAAAEKYKLIARMPLGETCRSTPAVSGGRLYLRTVSHLISLGGKQ